MNAQRWDIFCRVVDNYGDAGVCWRLARQLVAEHGLDVTLWIDRLATLARFQPDVYVDAVAQTVAGVALRPLADDMPASAPADVVIEAFGCGLPPAYVAAMTKAVTPPLWINLEYLSAEPWVDTVHGLASPQPRLPLERHFWVPGFTAHTGGLIREAAVLDALDAPNRERDAGVPLQVTLFCYPNRALPSLFDAWSEGDEAIRCAIPEGVATAALDHWLHGDVPHAGQFRLRGRLRLDVLPFTTQDGFDRMLKGADVNFVRGEDSFVRAQWAARPFVWQPYPQAEDAHRMKMEAFLARYTVQLTPDARYAVTAFWRAFNGEDGAAAAAAWSPFRAALVALTHHGREWAASLAALPDLTAGLVEFVRRRL
jgi:uncharacterized repeat protein (TIGR03837 family)